MFWAFVLSYLDESFEWLKLVQKLRLNVSVVHSARTESRILQQF
jgi:hypothetical protein